MPIEIASVVKRSGSRRVVTAERLDAGGVGHAIGPGQRPPTRASPSTPSTRLTRSESPQQIITIKR
jgi:hypothetical protein